MVLVPRSLLKKLEANSKEQLFQLMDDGEEKDKNGREFTTEEIPPTPRAVGGVRRLGPSDGASGTEDGGEEAERRPRKEISTEERRSREQQAAVMREFFGARERENGEGWEAITPPKQGPGPNPRTNSSVRRRYQRMREASPIAGRGEPLRATMRRERSPAEEERERTPERRRARSTPVEKARRKTEAQRERENRNKRKVIEFLEDLTTTEYKEAEKVRRSTIFAKIGQGEEEEYEDEVNTRLEQVRKFILKEDNKHHGHDAELCILAKHALQLQEQIEERAVALRLRELRQQHDDLVEKGKENTTNDENNNNNKQLAR